MAGDAILINNTPTMGIRPLGGSGQRSHALLLRMLPDHLGRSAARIFAEPVPSPDGVSIDWYAAAESDIRPLDRLPAVEQEPLRQGLAYIVREIEEHIDTLQAEGSVGNLKAAQALYHALKYPDDSFLFVADGRIIVTGWAYELEDAERASGNLSAWVRRSTAEPVTPVQAAPPLADNPIRIEPLIAAATPVVPVGIVAHDSRWSWLDLTLWLLLTLLLIAIFWRLLPACEIGLLRQLGLIDGCPQALAATDLSNEQRYGDSLQREVARLERDLAQRRYQCRIAPGAMASPNLPGTAQPGDSAAIDPGDGQEFDERLQDANATRGDLTISLKWSTTDDLDLIATCPDGEVISFQRKSACGGQLDIDANNEGDAATTQPIENIFWPEGNLSSGSYGVGVLLFKRRTGGNTTPIPFQIRVQLGENNRIIDGVAAQKGQVVPVTTFDVP